MDLVEWIQHNDNWLAGLGIASAVMFIASLILIPMIVIRLPADYFVSSHKHWLRNHPSFIPVFIIQHLIGVVLFIAGILMLVLPGQGILSIIIAISLISFPGKHRLLQWLFMRPRVHRSMNWIRTKANKKPFSIPNLPHHNQ